MEKPIKPEVLEELDDLEYLVELSETMEEPTWWQKIVIEVADEMKKK